MNVTLRDIYVGRADGSQEAEEKNFENLFYKENKKYDLLYNDETKFIISGKKGTGKTILAKYFEKEKNKEKKPTRILNKRELVLKIYMEKGKYELDREEIALFIEYTLLCELSKVILEEKKKLWRFKNIIKVFGIIRHLKCLEEKVKERFPAENFGMSSYQTSSSMSADIGGRMGNENHNITSNVRAEDSLNEQYVRNPYFQIIDSMKISLFYLMKRLSVNLIFDDLDELDGKIDSNDNLIKFLIDFIEVSNSLNNEMKRNKIKDSRIIILMRSDIIKVLNANSSNLNKIIADSEIRLNWMKRVRGCQMHPLMELIVTKIKNSNDELKYLTNEEVQKRFFPKTINGVPAMDHMLNCSFGRPRDIINMLNIIRNEYPDLKSFSADSFKDTQQEYSIKFTDELRNELSTHYERNIIEECFNIINYINKKDFWLSDVENAMNQHSDEIHHFKSKEEFVEFIYKHGIAGNTWENENVTGKKKYNFSWKYREDGAENPDYNRKFYLHLALRKTLLS